MSYSYTKILELAIDDATDLLLETGPNGEICLQLEHDIQDREEGKWVSAIMDEQQAHALYKGLHRALFGDLPEWAPRPRTPSSPRVWPPVHGVISDGAQGA